MGHWIRRALTFVFTVIFCCAGSGFAEDVTYDGNDPNSKQIEWLEDSYWATNSGEVEHRLRHRLRPRLLFLRMIPALRKSRHRNIRGLTEILMFLAQSMLWIPIPSPATRLFSKMQYWMT